MPPTARPAAPVPPGVTVFISYAHVDAELLKQLTAHLSALKREKLVDAWDDRQILAGDEWADVIDERLNQADVILLLVTADFINSEYCFGKELARALERHEDPADRAIVIPVILRECAWENTPFAKLQALPKGARPIPEWKTPDQYYTEVTKGLRQRLQRLIDPDSTWLQRVGRKLRDPRWWQQPLVWGGALGAIVLAGVVFAVWFQAATRADQHVATAVQDLRSGRATDAFNEVVPVCQAWVPRDACFVQAKAKLGVMLERQEDLEQFGKRLDALKAQRPDDPDLMFFSAQLALRENRPDRHPQARTDIKRVLETTSGRFPEVLLLPGQPGDVFRALCRGTAPARPGARPPGEPSGPAPLPERARLRPLPDRRPAGRPAGLRAERRARRHPLAHRDGPAAVDDVRVRPRERPALHRPPRGGRRRAAADRPQCAALGHRDHAGRGGGAQAAAGEALLRTMDGSRRAGAGGPAAARHARPPGAIAAPRPRASPLPWGRRWSVPGARE